MKFALRLLAWLSLFAAADVRAENPPAPDDEPPPQLVLLPMDLALSTINPVCRSLDQLHLIVPSTIVLAGLSCLASSHA